MSSTPPQKVTRDDIEHSLRAIQTGVEGKVVSQRTKIIRAASAAAWSSRC